MARSKNTKTHNVFLLDKEKLGVSEDDHNKVDAILADLMSKDSQYKPQKLQDNLQTNGFSIILYFRGDDKYQSKFAAFCKDFVAEGEDARSFYPRSASSVLFVWNERHIYAVTTGQGFRMIEQCAVSKFGLIVASIFQEKFRITSLDSNAMSSIVHSTKTVYSNEVDFINVNELDTIYKEITGRLNDKDKVQELLGLDSSSKKKSMKVIAKKYLQFSSALDFQGLIRLLSIIDGYDFENFHDRFNLIVPINEKTSASVVSSNTDAVISSIYAAIQANENYPFDLFHEDTLSFVSADSYVFYNQVSGDEYYSCDDLTGSAPIAAAFLEYLNGAEASLEAFSKFFHSTRIRADKGDVSGITDGSLIEHISGEVQNDGSNYYIFYGKYYQLTKSYSSRLNDSLRGKLREELFTSDVKTLWPQIQDEDWFNREASLSEGYAHLHRVLYENIEFADLVKLDEDVITVVHVKDGFDCKMRELDRQVELSIARIIDIRQNNREEFFKGLYQKATHNTTGKNVQTVFPTIDSFIDCLKNKKIRYFIVIRPKNKNLLENTSNIAKHCLNALVMRCFQQGIELRIQVV